MCQGLNRMQPVLLYANCCLRGPFQVVPSYIILTSDITLAMRMDTSPIYGSEGEYQPGNEGNTDFYNFEEGIHCECLQVQEDDSTMTTDLRCIQHLMPKEVTARY